MSQDTTQTTDDESSVEPGNTAQYGDDPYQKLCRAMTPGLLITVNCSHPSPPTGIDEMEVIRVDDAGDVHLRAHTGEQFVLTHNETENGAPVIKEVSETEFTPIRDPVLTIEVIGIAG